MRLLNMTRLTAGFLFMLLVFCQDASAASAPIQFKFCVGTATAVCASATVTGGNTLSIHGYITANTGAVSVADTQGNTWVQKVSSTAGDCTSLLGGRAMFMFEADNAAAGATVVTVTVPAGVVTNVYLLESSGLATSAFDQSDCNTGSGTTPSIGPTGTTAFANELVVALISCNCGSPATLPSGYTNISTDASTAGHRFAYKNVTATAAMDAAATLPDTTWWGLIVTLKDTDQPVAFPAGTVNTPILVGAAEITREAIAPNSETNHPLPLMASWATSWQYDTQNSGYTPTWVMQKIEQGHHLLPWFHMPDSTTAVAEWTGYYQGAIQRAKELNLPLVFLGTQWERDLFENPAYLNLPAAQNPNVVSATNGSIQPKPSPFGAVAPWQAIGTARATSPMMQQIQAWYPNPPRVIFLSNNESIKLQWIEVEQDQKYMSLYGAGRTDNFKRQVVGQGWIARYRALQHAWRVALTPSWNNKAMFIGYNAFGPYYIGRWSGWKEYSLYIPNRIDPHPLTWDGGSINYYMTSPLTDFRVMSPQMESMNFPFMQAESDQLNPSFWFEMSTWNECGLVPPAAADSDCQTMMANISGYTPERYAGMVQFAMWITRPRVVRDYRNWLDQRVNSEPYFTALLKTVDQIYVNPDLQRFWRHGQLVANTARPHPYQQDIPAEYATANRMFMLNTNLDPIQPWALSTVLPVNVMARLVGSAPNRQWLVYSFSPQQNRSGVQVTIPNYKAVSIGATVAGSFYLADEASNTVSLVDPTSDVSVSLPPPTDTWTCVPNATKLIDCTKN